MKHFRTHLTTISILFSIILLSHSCTVYKSANVSLNDASNAMLKTKVTKNNGKKNIYDRILLGEDGKYYGKKYIINKKLKTKSFDLHLIDKSSVKKVQLKDIKTSKILTASIPIVLLGVFLYAIINEGGSSSNVKINIPPGLL